jgi:hypothetical protein
LDKANGEIQADETRSVSAWLQAGIEVGRILVNHEREQEEITLLAENSTY